MSEDAQPAGQDHVAAAPIAVKSSYPLRRLVVGMTEAAGRQLSEQGLLDVGQGLMRELVARDNWLPDIRGNKEYVHFSFALFDEGKTGSIRTKSRRLLKGHITAKKRIPQKGNQLREHGVTIKLSFTSYP